MESVGAGSRFPCMTLGENRQADVVIGANHAVNRGASVAHPALLEASQGRPLSSDAQSGFFSCVFERLG